MTLPNLDKRSTTGQAAFSIFMAYAQCFHILCVYWDISLQRLGHLAQILTIGLLKRFYLQDSDVCHCVTTLSVTDICLYLLIIHAFILFGTRPLYFEV